MALYRGGKFENDLWQRIAAVDGLPSEGHVLLNLEGWRAFAASAQPSNVAFGLLLEPGQDLQAIAGDLPRISLVAINFPKFADGRGYSMARLLRDRYKFVGELRATGDVLFDQLQFLARCGFESFEIADPATLKLLEAGRRPVMTHFYQPAEGTEITDGSSPWRRRPA
jgi:uncharacterized protein (DUF934 family)